jgi:hypothetical protein
MKEKKYGDMVNGINCLGVVKSIEVDEDGVWFAVVRTEADRWARVYLVPSVCKKNVFPRIGDDVFMGGVVQSENRDANGSMYFVAAKANFIESPLVVSCLKHYHAVQQLLSVLAVK